MAKDCKERLRPTVCHMCGVEGHISDDCKDAKCLRCGLPSMYYSHTGCMHCRRLNKSNCTICGAKGHAKSTCPDLWRRFHATISGTEGVVNKPFGGIDRTHKPLTDIWCCNCAKQGHYVHHCSAYNYSSYPRSVLHVINYSNIMLNPDSGSISAVSSTQSLSKNQKRKKEMREIKARKQAFRSLNNTPNSSRSYENSSFSFPGTPDECFDEEQHNSFNSLEKAKQSLEELISMEETCETSTKKWRKRQKRREKESKNKDYLSINDSGEYNRKRSLNITNEGQDDNIFPRHRSKRQKKSSKFDKPSNLFNESNFQSKKRKSKSKHQENNTTSNDSFTNNRVDLFYGTSSRPPNMMHRLSKLSKIKRAQKTRRENKESISNDPKKRMDKKLCKLINQTLGDSKKSSHYALNQIVKNMKKKYKK